MTLYFCIIEELDKVSEGETRECFNSCHQISHFTVFQWNGRTAISIWLYHVTINNHGIASLKGKVVCSCHEGMWSLEVSLHSFSTLALDGDEWLHSCPGYCTPCRGRPLNRRLDGPQSQFGWFGKEKNLQPLFPCHPACSLGCYGFLSLTVKNLELICSHLCALFWCIASFFTLSLADE